MDEIRFYPIRRVRKRDDATRPKMELASALRAQGKTYAQIGTALGCSRQAIHQLLHYQARSAASPGVK
jgi:hypothetical protein